VPRRLAYALLGALLLACVLAFVRAEQLKLRRATVGGPQVPAWWSPICSPGPRCTGSARIRFRLRRPARVAVLVAPEHGAPIRTLLSARRRPKGRVDVTWNGRTDAGTPAPQGRYRVVIELPDRGRTMTVPTRINLDRTRPRVTVSEVRRTGDTVVVRYTTSEPATVFVAASRIVPGGKPEPVPGSLVRGRRGRAVWDVRGLTPGRYVLHVAARDRAGIRAAPHAPIRVRIR
jgi:hypothetical protein